MSIFFLIPLFLGVTVIAQGALNRSISVDWGLVSAVFLNAAVFLAVSFFLLLTNKYLPENLPDYLKLQNFDMSKFKWWFLIPGLCGFFLVLGIPWSMQLNGATKTFVLLIVTQVVLSLLFEKFFMEINVSTMKIVGAFIAMTGAVVVALSPN